MKIPISGFLIYLFLACYIAFAEKAAQSQNLATAINYMLAFVENSDCTFIRNDKAHTAKEAVAHMQRKYDHFKDEIKTPEDFIRLAASKSLMSGRPYMVRTKDGKLMKSETWLLEALKDYRTRQRQPDTDTTQQSREQ
ncbi:MAG: DUF5329 domain-containing protein [Deltaproteobacteria bacterium]|nr:DUF5329 domain-containing protein [Deltaproteobacteria bacterium]